MRDPIKRRISETKAMKSYRQRKRALGLCTYGGCWEPARFSYDTCEPHRLQGNAARRRAYAAAHKVNEGRSVNHAH